MRMHDRPRTVEPPRSRGWWGLLVLLLTVAGGHIRPAHAVNIGAPPVPITETLKVQPIIVCAGTGTVSTTPGTSCARSAGLGAYETYAQAIYDQAGIGVAFAAPEYYDNSAYLTTQADTTSSGLFDTAHNLLDIAGHGQSTFANTLNLYLVNNIISTTNGVPNGSGIYGYGLINGNGAIIATTPDSHGRQAALDTVAHEIGHNLGLVHVDSPPIPLTDPNHIYDNATNLMNTLSRTVPFETCQVTPYSCASPLGATAAQSTHAASARGVNTLTLASTTGVFVGMVATGAGIPTDDTVSAIVGNTITLTAPLTGLGVASGASIGFASPPRTDQLAPFQITTVRSPLLLTTMPQVSSVQGNFVNGSDQSVTIASATPISLDSIAWRFSNPNVVTGCFQFNVLPFPQCVNGTERKVVIGSHVEWTFTLDTPVTGGPVTFEVFCLNSPPTPRGTPCSAAQPAAYSTAFTFSDGVTSRAGFDATGQSNSQDGAVFTFDADTPGLPTGPSSLPTGPVTPEVGGVCPTGAVCEDTDPAWSTPGIVDATPLPFGALDGPSSVPEPASLLLLVAALGGLAAGRRGKSRVPR